MYIVDGWSTCRSKAISFNKWYHVVFSYNGSAVKLFVSNNRFNDYGDLTDKTRGAPVFDDYPGRGQYHKWLFWL